MTTHHPDRPDKGQAAPLGATFDGRGVNFALFSGHADKVDLCLFDDTGAREMRRLTLRERTGDVWHGYLDGAEPGLLYGYRVHGPYDPARGHRFNSNKLLVDPYAKSLAGGVRFDAANFGYRYGDAAGDLSFDRRDNATFVPKCRVVEERLDRPPSGRPKNTWTETVLYELHVRGYTKRHPDIAAELRGSFAALSTAAVIDYLLNLGITAVELLPVQAFADERHLVERGLTNYWAYNSFNFFCPDSRYLASGGEAEVRQCIDALHAAGIEVILDVVYNHTAEGDELGPTLSFRGIDNAAYYLLREDPRFYVNHSGCGNTLNIAHPRVQQMIVDSLAHWADRFDIDGFRFDLAVTLGRDPDRFDAQAPLLTAIRDHPLLAGLKLIAEPWDAGPDGHQTGKFLAGWTEWNDRYRDDVRRFWRGDEGLLGEFATRIAGSSDLFAGIGRGPLASVNFVTSHDGVTLRDLVTYAKKRNAANGEGNLDGPNSDFSSNCGEEGPNAAPAVQMLRRRQQRNLLATLLLSQGVPMLLAGDELGRTQRGNNNAYCQDNELSWVDWSATGDTGVDFSNFVKMLIRLRRDHAALRREHHFTGEAVGNNEERDIVWLHPEGREMAVEDWRRTDARILGLHLPGRNDEGNLLILFNAGPHPIRFTLPEQFRSRLWRRLIDTARDDPDCVTALASDDIWLEPHSLVVAIHRQEHSALLDLAEGMGIARRFWEIGGICHETTVATARGLLAAMGIASGSAQEVESSLRALRDRNWRDAFPPVTVIRTDSPIALSVTAPRSAFESTIVWKIIMEDGAEIAGELRGAELPIVDAERADSHYWECRSLHLSYQMRPGYHRVVLSGAIEADMAFIVAPARCYLPPSVAQGSKLWGLAGQLYSVRSASGCGIGDFRDLANLCAWAGEAGAASILLNPLHALFPDHPESASPYFPSSRSFLNPLYLSLREIPDFKESDEAQYRLSDPMVSAKIDVLRERDWIDYSGVARVKFGVLRLLYESFRKKHLDRADDDRALAFRRFVDAEGKALRDFTAFEVLAAHFGTPVWTDWPEEFQNPESEVVAKFLQAHADEATFRAYLQWQADEQLGAAEKAAEESGMCLGLCRDLAVGCSGHGADGWRYQGVYSAGARLGAPPDPFNPSGQDWGIAPTNPHGLRALAYAPFVEVLRANMRHAGVLRIDHVMGIARQFWVPAGAERRSGAYVGFPFDDLLGILALESQRNRCMVIGEDLGTVPEGLRERLAAAGVLSCRVLYFEQDAGRFRAPENYPLLSAACLSTHDLPTMRGYWRGVDLEEKRALNLFPSAELKQQIEEGRIRDKAGLLAALWAHALLDESGVDNGEGFARLWMAVHRYLARSRSVLAFVQLDDLTDEDVQINIPGTSDHERQNWRRRLCRSLEAMRADPVIRERLNMVSATRREIRSQD